MRINLLSSFAAGLLLATTISGTVYFTEKKDAPKAVASKPVKPSKASADDMKKELESKGYVVQTKAEYDENMKNAKAAETTQAPPAQNADTSAPVTKLVINVSQGMNNIDVGRMLVQAGFIENAFNFSKDIEARGLQNKLRPGSYEVDSGMSYDQIIATVYRQ